MKGRIVTKLAFRFAQQETRHYALQVKQMLCRLIQIAWRIKMKKHLCSIIILLFSFILSAQNNITLSSDQHMIYLGAIDKTTPVYIIRKDTEGLISTIKEYY